jgi:pimeloyl-ACP methyl ester carboxylesterase
MSRDLLQLDWREATHQVNGVQLHAVEAGRTGNPLVILLHGFPEFWWSWRRQITPLAEAGYHVVAPDLRGYNRSSAPRDVADYDLSVLAADVTGLAAALGADRFDLVGHDWGAVIGWSVTAHNAERVRKAVLMDGPHPDAWPRQMLSHPTQALRSAYVGLFQLPWVPEAMLGSFRFAGLRAAMRSSARSQAFEPGALDRYVEAWGRGSLTAMLDYYRALARRPWTQAPPVDPPVLVLWGSEDRFLERPVMEASAALCRDGRLTVVEGASHWLHLEEPERINAEILAFLGPAREAGDGAQLLAFDRKAALAGLSVARRAGLQRRGGKETPSIGG